MSGSGKAGHSGLQNAVSLCLWVCCFFSVLAASSDVQRSHGSSRLTSKASHITFPCCSVRGIGSHLLHRSLGFTLSHLFKLAHMLIPDSITGRWKGMLMSICLHKSCRWGQSHSNTWVRMGRGYDPEENGALLVREGGNGCWRLIFREFGMLKLGHVL